MDPQTHLQHVIDAGRRIAAVGESSDHEAPVPSMPGNTIGSLLIHTAGFCLWARSAVESGERPDPDFSVLGSDVRAAHAEQHAALVDTLRATDPAATRWSWGDDQRAAFWFRRAAQELAIHCWDAENAAGEAGAIDPHLAVDGVEEMFLEFGPPRDNLGGEGAARMFGGSGETLHLHTTDLESDDGHLGEWMVTCRPDHFEVRHEHAKGDVAARGTASDLLLFLWGRVGPDRFEVFGDASLLTRWQEQVRI